MKNKKQIMLLIALLSLLIMMPLAQADYGSTNNLGLRTDGEYIYRTLEDNILPYFNTSGIPGALSECNITIDSSSKIDGTYCMNITSPGDPGDGAFAAEHWFDYAMKPDKISFKFMVQRIASADYLYLRLFGPLRANMATLNINNLTSHRSLTITNFTSTANFTTMYPMKLNVVYTMSLTDIVYRTYSVTQSHLYTATLSNATASQTITGLQMGKLIPQYGLVPSIRGLAFYGEDIQKNNIFYFDDWTVGTQSNLTTGEPSNLRFAQAEVSGTLINDGSPLQDRSQTEHIVQILYDTTSHAIDHNYNYSKTVTGLTANTTETQTFTTTLTGLSEGTTYYYMAFVNSTYTNSTSTYYGEEYNFTTLVLPDYGNEVTNNVVYIIPTIVAVLLIVFLFAMLFTGTLTVESLIAWAIIFIIAMATIFTIFGISI